VLYDRRGGASRRALRELTFLRKSAAVNLQVRAHRGSVREVDGYHDREPALIEADRARQAFPALENPMPPTVRTIAILASAGAESFDGASASMASA
jgi:hypothetical protein